MKYFKVENKPMLKRVLVDCNYVHAEKQYISRLKSRHSPSMGGYSPSMGSGSPQSRQFIAQSPSSRNNQQALRAPKKLSKNASK